jgi:hypothetical protein
MIKKSLAILGLLFHAFLYAADTDNPPAPKALEPEQAYWIFSGMVVNENAEHFGYFFQMQKQKEKYHVKAGLLDGRTHQLIFYYDDEQSISPASENKWKIGHAFLRFNPINESWVFGVKMDNKQGFNFKVDLLNQNTQGQEIQTLSQGMDGLVYQTNKLNGHLQTANQEKEQFVTANNAWFSKVWLSTEQKSSHFLTSGFCRFQDGSGFYTENLKENDAKRAAVASWRDALGNVAKMSQFVMMNKLENNIWALQIAIPKLTLKLTNGLSQEATAKGLVAGFFPKKPQGFCFFTEQAFLEERKGEIVA